MTLGQDCLFGIPSAAVQALVDGRHGDPFSILGPYQCGWLCHVAVPRARSVGASGIVRPQRLPRATCSSPRREACDAPGMR